MNDDGPVELGDTVQDTISGFKGKVIGVHDWLYGCRRMTVQATVLKDGKPIEPVTFDEPQLKIVSKEKKALTRLRETGGPRPEPSRREAPRH